MRKAILLALLSGQAGFGQQSLTPPGAGYVVDAQRSLRPVLGVAGSFIVGEAILKDIVSAAWSGSAGLAKTRATVLVFDAQGKIQAHIAAGLGPALFAFDLQGNPALAYVPSTQILLVWHTDHFNPVKIDGGALEGQALTLAIGSNSARIVAQRSGGLWEVDLSLASGQVIAQRALPGVTAPVLLNADGSLAYADGSDLVTRSASGAETRIAAGVPIKVILRMSGDWIGLASPDAPLQYAIKLTAGSGQVWQLPEAR